MNLKAIAMAVTLSAPVLCARALDSLPPEAQERIHKLNELRALAHEFKEQVVKAPDDRKLHRKLLETGLQQYELTYTRARYPEKVRNDILELKVVIDDMLQLQRTVADIGGADGIDEKELMKRLKSAKVPYAHRRAAPLIDPWGTPYRFFIFPGNGQYKIVSAGRGKKFDSRDFGIQEKELMNGPAQRVNPNLDADIVFIDGKNFTRLPEYPKNAQTFLWTLCEPADELHSDRFECW